MKYPLRIPLLAILILVLAQQSLFAADTYIPSIHGTAPTATPTEVPTEVPTAVPTEPPQQTFQLQDGKYEADLSNVGYGWIDFTVTGNGTMASQAEFLISRSIPGCGGVTYTFSQSKPIKDGKFHFTVLESSVAYVATMFCTVTSSTTANCQATRYFYADGLRGFCNTASGTAILRD